LELFLINIFFLFFCFVVYSYRALDFLDEVYSTRFVAHFFISQAFFLFLDVLHYVEPLLSVVEESVTFTRDLAAYYHLRIKTVVALETGVPLLILFHVLLHSLHESLVLFGTHCTSDFVLFERKFILSFLLFYSLCVVYLLEDIIKDLFLLSHVFL